MEDIDLDKYYDLLDPVTKQKTFDKHLSPEEGSDLIHLVINNARSLFEDAIILYKHERYARSVTLAVLAIEEIGKIYIIRNIISVDSTSDNHRKELKDWWKQFRSHRSKNFMWVMPLLLDTNANNEQIEKFLNPKGKATSYLDELKMVSIYVDVLTNGQAVVPTKLDKDLCDWIMEICTIIVCQDQILTSSEALRLYKSHFPGGVNKYPVEHLHKYYDIAEERGYIEKGKAKQIREFGNISNP